MWYYVQTEGGTYAARISVLAYVRRLPHDLPTTVARAFGLQSNFFAEIESPGQCCKRAVPFKVTILAADKQRFAVSGWFTPWSSLGVGSGDRFIATWSASLAGGRLYSWQEFGYARSPME